MQMLRFLRRVFIILILLIIVFFIFRFIKPEATNRFVDKVRWIPTTISNRFHREKKSEIIINWNTTSTSSNFEINEDDTDDYDNEIYIPVVVDEDTTTNEAEDGDNWEMKDMSRLNELNKELDKILESWNNTVENNNESQNWNNIQITEITWNTLPSWFVVIDVEQPYTWTNQTNTQTSTTTNTTTSTTTNNWNNSSNNTQNNSNTSNNTTYQQWNCGPWLSVQDCEEMYNIFWNINID